MTLQEIASLVNRALKYKVDEAQIILGLDAVQKLAFSEHLQAFREYETNMTIYLEIEFLSAGYTSAITTDIGNAVVGGSSSTSGTLISYNNTTRKWVIDVTGDYTASESITITAGTGAGTLLATDHQIGFNGPYAYPTSPPVRKLHGVTTITDAKIFGTDITYENETDDYSMNLTSYHPRKLFKPGRTNDIAKEYTFSSAPNRTDTYRWFYWYYPNTISDLTTGSGGDSALLIPESFHGQYAQACVGWLRAFIKGEPSGKKHIEGYLKDWWDELKQVYTPSGKSANQTSRGTYMGDFFSV